MLRLFLFLLLLSNFNLHAEEKIVIGILDPRGEKIYLPVPSMVAVAGAGFLNERGGILRGLSPEAMYLFNKGDPTKSVIFGNDHAELRDELSKVLHIPVLKEIDRDL